MGPGVGCGVIFWVLFGLWSWGKLPKRKGGPRNPEKRHLKMCLSVSSPKKSGLGENFVFLEDGFGPEYLFLSDFGPETYSKVEMLL